MKKKITPSELAERLAPQVDMEKSQAENFVKKFFELVGNGLLEDKYVKIKSFGTFKLVSVGERESININTGERFQISGHTKVSFTADSTLKELVNRPFAHFEAVDLNDETETEELDSVGSGEALDADTELSDDAEELETDEQQGASDEEQPSANNAPASSAAPVYPSENSEETERDIVDNEIINLSDPVETLEADETPAASSEKLPAQTFETASQTVEMPSNDDSPSEGNAEAQDGATEAHAASTFEDENADSTVVEAPAEAENAATEGIVPSEGGASSSAEEVETSAAAQESAAEASEASADEPEIEVSSPRPITTSSDGSSQAHTSSSIAGFVYEEVPSTHKRNAWKYVTLAFCAVLLMCLCYFAGYFRLLCPECIFTDVPDAPDAPVVERPQDKPARPVPRAQRQVAPVPPAGNGPQNPAASPSASQQPSEQQAAEQTPNAASDKPQPSASQPEAHAPSASAPQAATKPIPEKPQVVKHTVKSGENLTRIVRRHYGSDAYVNKVVKYNNLKNADNVAAGTVIELPPLK